MGINMNLTNKENFIVNKTIQYLAEKNAVAPEYLGEFQSMEDIEMNWNGYFAWSFVKEKINIFTNMFELAKVVRAVDLANETKLTEDESDRVLDGVANTVSSQYSNFIVQYGRELPGLMDGSITVQ